MSLEKNFEIKSQQFVEKKQAEAKIAEEKNFSSFRKEISGLESKKNEISTSVDNLQELAGLQQNEVKDYLKTKKVIEGLFEKHRETLAEEGIKDKKDIISAYPKEDEVEAYQQAHQKLKTTAEKIIEERKNLKEEGIENVRGKKFAPEIKERTSELDKKIKELKLQTPEGKEERKQELKNKIKESLKQKIWYRGIEANNFIQKEHLQEAKNYGEDGEQIIKQTITEYFQGNNEKIKSSREINQEFSLLSNFEKIISSSSLSNKIEKIKDLTEVLPEILAEELKKNPKLLRDCQNYFPRDDPETILTHAFFADYMLRRVDGWLSNASSLCRSGENLIKSGYSRWDKYGEYDDSSNNSSIFPNVKNLNEDAGKMLDLFSNLRKNLGEELSSFIKIRKKWKSDEPFETDTSSKLKAFYGKKDNNYADYVYKPSKEIKKIIGTRGFGFNGAKGEAETKIEIEQIKNKLSAKIDLDWLKQEESLLRDEKKVWKIENNKGKIDQEKKMANYFLDNFHEMEKNLEGRFEEKIRYEKVKKGRDEGELFYSPVGRENLDKLWELRHKNVIELEETSSRKRKMENEGTSIFKKKAWQAEINDLEKKEKDLKQEDEVLGKEQKKEQEKEEKLSGLNKILQALPLGQEFINKEMTLGEVIKILHDKLNFIQSKEGLSPEERTIYQDWQALEGRIKEAESKYLKTKQELPNF